MIGHGLDNAMTGQDRDYTLEPKRDKFSPPDVVLEDSKVPETKPKGGSFFGKAFGLLDNVMSGLDKMAKENPHVSKEDIYPDMTDAAIAAGVNKELEDIQEKMPLDQRLEVGPELFSGNKADMMNLMTHIGDNMNDPSNKEGLFERMLEVSEMQAADRIDYATPLLPKMRELHASELSSVEKFDTLRDVARSAGYYNPFGDGQLQKDEDGVVTRDIEIAHVRDAHQLPLSKAEIVDGVSKLSLRDAATQLTEDSKWARLDGQFKTVGTDLDGLRDRQVVGSLLENKDFRDDLDKIMIETNIRNLGSNETYIDVKNDTSMDAADRSESVLWGWA